MVVRRSELSLQGSVHKSKAGHEAGQDWEQGPGVRNIYQESRARAETKAGVKSRTLEQDSGASSRCHEESFRQDCLIRRISWFSPCTKGETLLFSNL